ncbi:TonB-dependent receptor [Govanella unica]|uniref:TonB-dependent receptor n=1 Tax=Govanella unica TaxID=2975056 RepID=A0A9X3TZ55_9PROT|nr:TonB-dependent receptor [Govania unica]MDA5194139.1 TonB-dependent receptor [Govania unica]
MSLHRIQTPSLKARLGVLAGGSLLALSVALPAAAQNAVTGFEEIVVTAQRREQNLQDVPISIKAMSGEQLQALQITKAADISALTPGLFASGSRGDSNPIFAIRGIGLNDSFSNNNPTVGVYIDEVVQPFTPLLGFALFDIERVEVLKGPQGTLYGRNTTGGAINFISKKPTQNLDAYASASYSRFNRLDLEGAVGGGLSDTLAVRVSGKTTQQSGGWQTNDVTGEKIGDKDSKALRAQILWTPTDNFEMLLKGDLFKDRSDQQLREHVGYYQRGAAFGTPCQGAILGFRDENNCVDALGYSNTNPDRRHVANSEVYGHESITTAKDLALNMKWDLGNVVLTSVTGYTDYNRVAGDDSDGSPLIQLDSQFTDDIKAFSQELRLASNNSGPVTWVVGGFYSWDRINGDVLQALDDHFFHTRVDTSWKQTTNSYALFGQAEWQFADKWRLTGGLRYTNERKSFAYDSIDLNPYGDSTLPMPVAGINDKLKQDNVSGKIGLDFQAADDLLLYASASKGFKSGGFKGAIAFNAAELEPFRGENLYAYEVGAKSTLFDGRLQLNAAAYYYDWKDFQAFVTEIRAGGINVIVLNNAGDARVYGLELEATARPVDGLTVQASANVMNTKVRKINPAVEADYLGNQLANSPEFALSGLVRYQLPIEAQGFGSYVLVDGSYRSNVYYSINNRGQSAQKGYVLLNARVAVTSLDNRWEFAVWGRNLTNKLYVSNSYDNYGGIFPSQNFLGDPRTYGATLSFKY